MKVKRMGGSALILTNWTVQCSAKDFAAFWDFAQLSEAKRKSNDLSLLPIKEVMGVISKHCTDGRYLVALVSRWRSLRHYHIARQN